MTRTVFIWKSLQAVSVHNPSLMGFVDADFGVDLTVIPIEHFCQHILGSRLSHLNLDLPVDVSTCELCLYSNYRQWRSVQYCQWCLKMDTHCLVS